MNQTAQRRALRICRAAVYPLAAAFDLWVLYLALSAAGIPLQSAEWWILWAGGYVLLSFPARKCDGRIAAVMTYAWTVHGVLAWAALAGLVPLIILPLWGPPGIRAAGILALSCMTAGILAASAGIRAGRRLHLREYTLTTAKVLPRGLLRIVHLSDLHLGHIQNARFTAALVRRVNSLSPDLVCITGDFFSDTMRTVPGRTADILAGLSARYGVYACLGNHDTADKYGMAAFFSRAGIRILADEAIFPAGNLAVIGREDASPGGIPQRRDPIGECMIGTDPLQYRIVLDHQPRDIGNTAAAGADLLLCGHTHGGQFYPIRTAVRRRYPCYAGMYLQGTLSVAVSPGSSAGAPPIRLGSRGEIFLITVRQDAESV